MKCEIQIRTHSNNRAKERTARKKKKKDIEDQYTIQQHKGQRKWYLEFHFCVLGLLPFLHKTQTEGLEVDLMFCLFYDLSQQSP